MVFKMCAMGWQAFKSIAFSFLPNIIFWFLAFIWPFIIAVLGRKVNWTWPHTLLAFTGAMALGLFIYHNIPINWPVKAKKIENNLRKWADAGGFSIKSEGQEYARFQFVITDEAGHHVTVINKKDASPLEIIIATKVSFSPEQQRQLIEKGKERQTQFIDELKMELLKFGIGFTVPSEPIEEISLVKTVFYDNSVTRVHFLEDVLFVRRALYLVMQIVNQELPI